MDLLIELGSTLVAGKLRFSDYSYETDSRTASNVAMSELSMAGKCSDRRDRESCKYCLLSSHIASTYAFQMSSQSGSSGVQSHVFAQCNSSVQARPE